VTTSLFMEYQFRMVLSNHVSNTSDHSWLVSISYIMTATKMDRENWHISSFGKVQNSCFTVHAYINFILDTVGWTSETASGM